MGFLGLPDLLGGVPAASVLTSEDMVDILFAVQLTNSNKGKAWG